METDEIIPAILVVDIETTGLDPVRNSIIEIGATWLTGPKTSDVFSCECRMWDGAEYDPDVEERNGWSKADCENINLDTEADAIEELFGWMGTDYPVLLAGLNPRFDLDFIRSAAGRADLSHAIPFPHRTLDLHALVVADAIANQVAVPARGFYTDDIYEYLGMSPEPKPHEALTGAKMEAEAFATLMGL